MNSRIFLSALSLSLLISTSCKKDANLENCAERAPEAWQKGVQKARDENKADFERGKAEALLLTYDDGKTDGLKFAYNAGYNSNQGYPKGYNERYPKGYNDGLNDFWARTRGDSDGRNKGATDGRTAGSQDGDFDGYSDGYDISYADGYDDGYYDGYRAGGDDAYGNPSSCGVAAPMSRKRNWPLECEQNGYQSERNAQGNYNQGYNLGKSENADYQRGFVEFKVNEDAYNRGVFEGYNKGLQRGYDDGFAQGYSETYDRFFKLAYDQAYGPAYASAYSWAYRLAFDEGYDDGYDEGYDEGFDDGFSDGRGDACFDIGESAAPITSGGLTQSKAPSFIRFKKTDNKLKQLQIKFTRQGKTVSHTISRSFAKNYLQAEQPMNSSLKPTPRVRPKIEVAKILSKRQNLGKGAWNRNVMKRGLDHLWMGPKAKYQLRN